MSDEVNRQRLEGEPFVSIVDQCDYEGCEDRAEFIDSMGNYVCTGCMLREIESGTDSQSFEPIQTDTTIRGEK